MTWLLFLIPTVYWGLMKVKSGMNSFIVFIYLAFRVLIDQFSFLSFLRKFFPLQNFTFHIQSVIHRFYVSFHWNKSCKKSKMKKKTSRFFLHTIEAWIVQETVYWKDDFSLSGVEDSVHPRTWLAALVFLHHVPCFHRSSDKGFATRSTHLACLPIYLPLGIKIFWAPVSFSLRLGINILDTHYIPSVRFYASSRK